MAYKRWGAVPLSRSAGNPSIIQCGLRPMSTSVHSGVFIHPAVWPQYCRRGRSLSVQDNFGTYAFGTCFFRTSSFGTLNVDIGTVTCGALSRDVRGDVFVDVDSLSDRPAVINI